MAVTRSATRHLSNTKADITKAVKVPTRSRVKTTSEEKVKESRKNASKRVKAKSTNRVQPSQNVSVKPEMQLQETVAKPVSNHISTETFLPAVLTFSFENAKQHLIKADPRFEDLFSKMKCRPFEHLERVDPFRTLCTSILGQQISWLAARSITHKFRRLFNPALPEQLDPSGSSSSDAYFPSAAQVATQDIPTLRTAGLSQRKAEYVQDLASRFVDGRLSNEKILQASDEELYEMLTAVRGIGKWTVDMFAIFSLRRPDILPEGDLGVQRGVLRWFLSLHSPKYDYFISPRKLPKEPTDSEQETLEIIDETSGNPSLGGDISDNLLIPPRASTPDVAPIPPTQLLATPKTPTKNRKGKNDDWGDSADKLETDAPLPPPAFTPSIKRTLGRTLPPKYAPPPLPEGLTVNELKNRVDGKKKVAKKALLTPNEITELTSIWQPYRSLGVYYMWALAEGSK